MRFFSWKDCSLTIAGEQVVLRNSTLSTQWHLDVDGLALACVENPISGYRWRSENADPIAPVCMTPPDVAPKWETQVLEDNLCSQRWMVQCIWYHSTFSVRRCFVLYPNAPFLTMWTEWENPPEDAFQGLLQTGQSATGIEKSAANKITGAAPGDVMTVVPLPAGHLRWQCIRLSDQTDVHDTLTWEQSAPVYPTESVEASGSFFTVEDPLAGESLFAARHAPITPSPGPQFRLAGGRLYILQNGCAGAPPDGAVGCTCVLGAAPTGQLWEQYRFFYRLGWTAPWQQYALLSSNTWGDRSRDARVCEAFLLQEIDRAASLGLDAVQIDDGWQKGRTKNSVRPDGGVWEGYYDADEDFWTPHPERFPNGLEPVVEYAASSGVALGLWFSPDSSQEFANWQRDAQTMLKLWHKYGVAVFKLDGVKLRTPLARRRYLALLETVSKRSGGRILLQQDITAEERMGYLAMREYGTLFVENRYTDFANYYPHRTLRNLWMLSRYIPAQRMLFEVLNPRRNRSLYQKDPFAPELYSADYLFASVMPAQPLFWMELSGLEEKDFACLREIVSVYRQYREALWKCDVQPVGQEPSGRAFTGFVFRDQQSRQEGFLLLFRENTTESTFPFTQVPHSAQLRLLCANNSVSSQYTADNALRLWFTQPRSYAFYRWETGIQ